MNKIIGLIKRFWGSIKLKQVLWFGSFGAATAICIAVAIFLSPTNADDGEASWAIYGFVGREQFIANMEANQNIYLGTPYSGSQTGAWGTNAGRGTDALNGGASRNDCSGFVDTALFWEGGLGQGIRQLAADVIDGQVTGGIDRMTTRYWTALAETGPSGGLNPPNNQWSGGAYFWQNTPDNFNTLLSLAEKGDIIVLQAYSTYSQDGGTTGAPPYSHMVFYWGKNLSGEHQFWHSSLGGGGINAITAGADNLVAPPKGPYTTLQLIKLGASKFQPTVTSQVRDTVVDVAPGSGAPTITDDITAHKVGTAAWAANTSVRFDFDLYTCTDRHAPPATNGNGNVANTSAPSIPSGCTKVSTTNATFNADGTTRTIQFIGDRATNPAGGHTDGHFAYSSGKNYYIVARMDKGKQDGTNGYPNSKDKLVDNWYAPFSTEGEQSKTTFSPEVTSSASSAGGSNYITAGTNFVDKITVKSQTASVVSTSYGNPDSSPTWLKNDSGAYIPVKACVQAYGPAAGPYATTTGPFVPNTATDLPAELKTKPKGSPVCNDVSPSLGSPAGTVDFTISTTGWTPGYYYFITTIDGSNQAAGTADYLAGQSNFSYTSPFNPAAPQREWGYIKFQPLARSMMEGNRYSEDKGTSGRGTNKGVVFDCDENKQAFEYPGITDAQIPSKLTCRSVTDHIYIGAADTRIVSGDIVTNNASYIKDEYWPRTSSATGNNFAPIKYEVELYGPFADPEGRNPATPADAHGKTVTTVPYTSTTKKESMHNRCNDYMRSYMTVCRPHCHWRLGQYNFSPQS